MITKLGEDYVRTIYQSINESTRPNQTPHHSIDVRSITGPWIMQMFRWRRESMNTKLISLHPNTKLFSGQFKVAFALTLFTSNWAMSSRGGALGAAFAFRSDAESGESVIPSLDIKLTFIAPEKMLVGKWSFLFWETWFSGAMLVSGRVSTCLPSHGNTYHGCRVVSRRFTNIQMLFTLRLSYHHITLLSRELTHPTCGSSENHRLKSADW